MGGFVKPVVGQGHGLFPVRVDQAASGRGQQAMGQQLVPVDAGLVQGWPQAFQIIDKVVLGFLVKGLKAGGDEAPGQDTAPLQKAADALAVAAEDFAVGVDVHGQYIKVSI